MMLVSEEVQGQSLAVPTLSGDGKWLQGWTDVNSNRSGSTGPPAGAAPESYCFPRGTFLT